MSVGLCKELTISHNPPPCRNYTPTHSPNCHKSLIADESYANMQRCRNTEFKRQRSTLNTVRNIRGLHFYSFYPIFNSRVVGLNSQNIFVRFQDFENLHAMRYQVATKYLSTYAYTTWARVLEFRRPWISNL